VSGQVWNRRQGVVELDRRTRVMRNKDGGLTIAIPERAIIVMRKVIYIYCLLESI
jgi:hypothetical protein